MAFQPCKLTARSVTCGAHQSFSPFFPSPLYKQPPFTHGAINWNVQSVPAFRDVVDALLLLKNETVLSGVRPYTTAGLSLSKEKHEAMHSKLTNSSIEHPHSFVYTAVHGKDRPRYFLSYCYIPSNFHLFVNRGCKRSSESDCCCCICWCCMGR